MLAANRPIATPGLISQLIIAQGTGVVMACGIVMLSGIERTSLILLSLVLTQSIVAAVTARMLAMPFRWVGINLVFAPALLGALQLDVDPLVYAAGFLALLAIFGTASFATRVPLFLSGKRALARLEPWLPRKPFSMIDLGAGTGRVLRFVARRRSNAALSGVEVAPLPFVVAWLRSLWSGYRVSFDNFWNCDLSGYDVVFAYLSPAPMEQLWDKAAKEMRTGSLFISNSFAVPGVPPTSVVRYGKSRGALLYIWRMP